MTVIDELREVTWQITESKQLLAKRNKLIVKARQERYAWNDIINATGLTRQAVTAIYRNR